eukprot:gene10790-3407_t
MSGSKKMKFTDAAELILKESTDSEGLGPKEIAQLAINKGYISTNGKTPHASMSAAITENIKQLGEGSAFQKIGSAKYKYRELSERTEVSPKKEDIQKKPKKKPKNKKIQENEEFKPKSTYKTNNDLSTEITEVYSTKRRRTRSLTQVESDFIQDLTLFTSSLSANHSPNKKSKIEQNDEDDEDDVPKIVPVKKRIQENGSIPAKKRILKETIQKEEPKLKVSKISVFKDLKQLPVLYPTMEEFEDFSSYILKIQNVGMEFGCIKIVPPKEWRPSTDLKDNTFECYDEKFNVSDMEINPVLQKLSGKRGIFQVSPEKQSEFKVLEFKEKSESIEPQTKKVEEIDAQFWRGLNLDTPLYAYDIPKSFFKPGVPWDLNNLNSLLGYVRCEIPGVTTPYLYFGTWKSNFSWHVEDMNLYSVNYLHFGKPKQWYSVPSQYHKKVEELSEELCLDESDICKRFIKHKTTLISPAYLLNNDIPVYVGIQNPGEFIITFPAGYHSGFNHGFNCAEATNFALEPWLKYAENRHCNCPSRRINWEFDMDNFSKAIL